MALVHAAHAGAGDIANNFDASVERSVSGARQALDAQADGQDKRRLAAEALNGASMIKVALSEASLPARLSGLRGVSVFGRGIRGMHRLSTNRKN